MGSYRYGFNGQEKSDEIAGYGNSYVAEFWQYDSRLGRRWNTDPVVKSYESPYASLGNNPIRYVDYYGADTSLPMPGNPYNEKRYMDIPEGATFETYSKRERLSDNIYAEKGDLKSFKVKHGKHTDTYIPDYDRGYFYGYRRKQIYDWNGWDWTKAILNEISPVDVEVYTGLQGKVTIQKGSDPAKVVMPIGLQYTFNTTSGTGESQLINPLKSTYFNYNIKNWFIDFRVMPGQSNERTGDLVGTRLLFTVPQYSKGPFKTQFDIASGVGLESMTYKNVSIGMRVVLESPVDIKVPIINTTYSIEGSAGFRIKPRFEKLEKILFGTRNE